MVDVANALKTHDEEYALPDSAREVLGGVALDAIVGDNAARSALVQEMNVVLQGSGLEVVDTEITETHAEEASAVPELKLEVVDNTNSSVSTPADAIRKFWSLPPETRSYLRRRSHVEGYNGLIVNVQGRPLFRAAAKHLSTHYSVYYKSE